MRSAEISLIKVFQRQAARVRVGKAGPWLDLLKNYQNGLRRCEADLDLAVVDNYAIYINKTLVQSGPLLDILKALYLRSALPLEKQDTCMFSR